MLYHLLYPLSGELNVLNVFKYITFRTFGAALTALFLSFLVGPYFIRLLKEKQFEQAIRTDGPKTHFAKQGTPTMGGILILFCMTVSTLLWADLQNAYIWCVLAVTIGFGAIGFFDDYRKIIKKNSKGLSGKTKLFFQGMISFIAAYWIYKNVSISTDLTFPFFKNLIMPLGIFYILFSVLVIVGTSNAVNLTDGLDGLAIGPVMIVAGTFLLLCYIAGHVKIAQYLQIPYIAGAGELSIFCGSLVTSGLGFLWFSSYPAQIFMGDVGALSLGGALGILAVLIKQEILLFIIGGVFVAEAISVISQVASYKLTRKRIFKMAPLHHHFELMGWPEPKIVVRFWIISIILAIVALSTLKLR